MIDPVHFQRDKLVEIRSFVGEYSFRLSALPGVKLSVKVWKTDVEYGGDRYTYTTSHYIQVPWQASRYTPGSPFAPGEKEAVEKAITDILFFYTSGQSQGFKPSADWFVRNEDY